MIPGLSQLMQKGQGEETKTHLKKMMIIMDSMNNKGKYTKALAQYMYIYIEQLT